ncbi:LacI family DNA-binding transcriptional regulator [Aeromicrobium sp. IC_218]|uniref:LacI family DNA-binding transcriptional regulator n=1 Tax=Aeromicrobium sp. IC_218 TaxID=2545468 RepID=UPI00103D2538|nr:LacI family DNA-binding transcriptional regulator [Aeromicrobium sp. IC_218]TCJ00682.1 LacI family transcriptional regulator [Aeromicrobium sp. IC_218]
MPETSKRPTIRDVAREAGVSVTTVSHAMNNKGRLDVRTRERVIEVANRLGYVPNRAAQRLVSGKSLTIGLLMPPSTSDQVFSTDMHAPAITAAAHAAVEAGYALTIMPQLPTDGTLGPHVVDGVLVLEPQPDDPRVAGLRRLNLPFVAVGDSVPDAHSVHAHEVDGARQLLDHLRSLGARSIGVLAPEHPTASVQESLQALQDLWTLPEEEIVVEHVPLAAVEAGDVSASADQLLAAADVHALIGLHPTFGAALVQAVAESGRSVPGDVLVAQYVDGISAAVSSPALTALDVRPAQQAALGLTMLLEMLAGKDTPKERIIRPRLTVRTSTVARRRGDRMLARRESVQGG